MSKKLQHGAASKSPKRSFTPSDNAGTIDVPAELGYLNDCQQKLNDSNKQLWKILTKLHWLRRLPQFKGTKDEDFLTWFEDL